MLCLKRRRRSSGTTRRKVVLRHHQDHAFPERMSSAVMRASSASSSEDLDGMMEVSVELPWQKETSAVRVPRSMPMMDVLVQVATAHGQSPTAYVGQLRRQDSITPPPFAPSSPVGTLDSGCVLVLRPRRTSTRRPAPSLPSVSNTMSSHMVAKSHRLQVLLPRKQMAVLRLTPETPLAEVLTTVCNQKGLDARAYTLRLPEEPRRRLPGDALLGPLQRLLLLPEQSDADEDARLYAASREDLLALRRRPPASVASSASSDSGSGSSASPTPPTTLPRRAPSPPPRRRKKRPAPPPPPAGAAGGAPVMANHSRQSSDSSGYHEASLLSSDSPVNGAGSSPSPPPPPLAGTAGGARGNAPPPPPVRHAQRSSSLLTTSSASMASLATRKKSRAPPPPPVADSHASVVHTTVEASPELPPPPVPPGRTIFLPTATTNSTNDYDEASWARECDSLFSLESESDRETQEQCEEFSDEEEIEQRDREEEEVEEEEEKGVPSEVHEVVSDASAHDGLLCYVKPEDDLEVDDEEVWSLKEKKEVNVVERGEGSILEDEETEEVIIPEPPTPFQDNHRCQEPPVEEEGTVEEENEEEVEGSLWSGLELRRFQTQQALLEQLAAAQEEEDNSHVNNENHTVPEVLQEEPPSKATKSTEHLQGTPPHVEEVPLQVALPPVVPPAVVPPPMVTPVVVRPVVVPPQVVPPEMATPPVITPAVSSPVVKEKKHVDNPQSSSIPVMKDPPPLENAMNNISAETRNKSKETKKGAVQKEEEDDQLQAELCELREELMKWQQQLLRNHTLLQSSAAPPEAQKPTAEAPPARVSQRWTPPTVQLGSWDERPKRVVSLKADSDYVLGGAALGTSRQQPEVMRQQPEPSTPSPEPRVETPEPRVATPEPPPVLQPSNPQPSFVVSRAPVVRVNWSGSKVGNHISAQNVFSASAANKQRADHERRRQQEPSPEEPPLPPPPPPPPVILSPTSPQSNMSSASARWNTMPHSAETTEDPREALMLAIRTFCSQGTLRKTGSSMLK